MIPDPTTAEWALIVVIVLARLLVPLLIPRCELVIVAALVLDAVDNSLLAAFTDVDLGPDGPYQGVDKALDIYYLAIAYAAMLRNWTSHAAFRIGQFLFYYRLVGVLGFELLDERPLLIVFPNTFEYFFIVYALVALRWDPASWPPRFWLWTAVALWVLVKLPQEYWIHIGQWDYTEAVADHPWFGFACAAGLGVLAVLYRRFARPRLPAPEHPARWAAPKPDEHWRRKSRWRWSEVAEKVVLLGLITVVFAHILPDVRTSALDVVIGVTLLVFANTAISLRWGRLQFGALLFTNLGLIYLQSRTFTPAENFPVGTALFFAFLISLLLSLYERYKPVHESRFHFYRRASMEASSSR